MRLFIVCFFLLLTYQVIANDALALRVFTKNGNVYLQSNTGSRSQLTAKNIDSNPVLSPDKNNIAFIRKSNRLIPNGCSGMPDTGSKYANEIWLYDLANKKESLLVANNFDCGSVEKQIVDPRELQFSPDGKTLYFVTSAWVTSGAVHAVNLDGTGLRYVIPGSSLEVITKGQYKGDLIVTQHRYFVGGGSYDWYWVFTPAGKEEGPLGPSLGKDQRDMLEEG